MSNFPDLEKTIPNEVNVQREDCRPHRLGVQGGVRAGLRVRTAEREGSYGRAAPGEEEQGCALGAGRRERAAAFAWRLGKGGNVSRADVCEEERPLSLAWVCLCKCLSQQHVRVRSSPGDHQAAARAGVGTLRWRAVGVGVLSAVVDVGELGGDWGVLRVCDPCCSVFNVMQ